MDDVYYDAVNHMEQQADAFEAEGIPVDGDHLRQLLDDFRERLDAADALYACHQTCPSSYPFCGQRDSCLHCQVCV